MIVSNRYFRIDSIFSVVTFPNSFFITSTL